MPLSDEQLVKATLDGDPDAYEEIVKRCQHRVFSIVYHYLGRRNEVEDIGQEVFLKLYRSLPRYDPTKPLEAWVCRITVNTCLDELRRRKVRKTRLFSDMSLEEEENLLRLYEKFEGSDTLTEEESEEAFRGLWALIGQLSNKDRMAFVLREIEGLSYKKIAEILGVSEVAVRIRVSRTRKHLLELLKESHFANRIWS